LPLQDEREVIEDILKVLTRHADPHHVNWINTAILQWLIVWWSLSIQTSNGLH